MKRPIQALAGLALPMVLAATMASPAAAASAISQPYACTTPAGPVNLSATITGTATKTTTQIVLTNVKFTVKNTFPSAVVLKNIKVRVPDPATTAALYVTGSAKVASTTTGWTAGHETTPVKAIFSLHAANLSVPLNGSTTGPALSAKYTKKGAKGTVIKFVGGKITFMAVKPIAGNATCSPSGAKIAFATVTL